MSEDNIDVLDAKESRYEDMLLSILQNEGKIQPFLDHIFRFLYRKTDFYLVQEKADQPYGFPAGVSEQIVRRAYQKYDGFSKEKLKQKLLTGNENVEKPKEVKKSSESDLKKVEKINKDFSDKSIDSQKEKLKKQQEVFQSNASSYNGAIRESYSWGQNINDIDIQVKLDANIKSSKDVKIKIEKEHLQVLVKAENGTFKQLIDDRLPWKIKPDESTWSLHPGDHIHIYLEKASERWWEHLLVSEEKLDLKNMNPEKPMEDLDQESQAKLKQMMFDEQQKRLGLPTSEQQKTTDMLKKAWDCDGSPFKGQPFDPSIVMNSNEKI